MIERGPCDGGRSLTMRLARRRSSGRSVGEILVEPGALSAFELARVLADHMGVPFTDLRSKPPDPIIAALLPEEVARRYDALGDLAVERPARRRDGEPHRPVRARRSADGHPPADHRRDGGQGRPRAPRSIASTGSRLVETRRRGQGRLQPRGRSGRARQSTRPTRARSSGSSTR